MKRALSIPKPGKEVVLEAAKLSNAEARFLVANYYTAQDARKREDMQRRHFGDITHQEANVVLDWARDAHAEIEAGVLRGLKNYAEASPVGYWMMAQHGVGPVIAAGFLAHLDIEKAPTAGHFWSFAGLNPSCKWEKGEKRPYNAQLKQLCYHLGECIKRTWKDEGSFYGPIYGTRKELLVERNERGYNAERAKTFRTQSKDVRKVLAEGKLPAGNLDRQACNYVAKIFLSHLHAVMLWDKYGDAVSLPYSIAMLNHAHFIEIPLADKFFPGLNKTLRKAVARAQAKAA